MEIKVLYNKLCDAYSDKNLNEVTATIIDAYKAKQYGFILKIAKVLSEHFEFDAKQVSKCFSKLVMLYHPDKGDKYRDEIKAAYQANDFEALMQFAHILTIENIDDTSYSSHCFNHYDDDDDDDDIGYDPEYIYDIEDLGDSFSELKQEIEEFDSFTQIQQDISFYSAVKRKIYGNLNIEMPSYYLEDLEDIEMAEYDINSLEGIKHCKYLNYLDLSRNNISDISEIKYLDRLEELYLANNEIYYIDSLIRLYRLRVLDISHNYIEDINALLRLPNLEYVNVMGNNLSMYQIGLLQAKDIIVVH